jgi:hypothetical protein
MIWNIFYARIALYPKGEFMHTDPTEQNEVTMQHDSNVAALASELHEQWRQSRYDSNTGTFEPRVKETKDVAWIEKHNTNQVDIANTEYANLPEDWQAENKASAEVAITAVEQAMNSGVVELNEDFVNKASDIVHQKWLERNGEWAPAEQKLPYAELSEEEKEKDRVFVRAAIKVVTDSELPQQHSAAA